MTRIVIVDDHELVRRGLVELLRGTGDLEVVGQAATATEGRRRVQLTEPDVAVFGARFPDGSGIQVCRDLRPRISGLRFLILTAYEDDDAVVAAVRAGASGYLLKRDSGASLIAAIRTVAGGGSLIDSAMREKLIDKLRQPIDDRHHPVDQLNSREVEILDLLAQGLSNREIGERMYLAEKTIKNYVSIILSKLGMERRTQAAVYGVYRQHKLNRTLSPG